MEANTAPELPQDGGSVRAARIAPISLIAKSIARLRPRGGDGPALWPPSPLVAAVAIVAIAIAFTAVLSYYSAREFSGRAADTRASNEAMSFASHSSRLANGDAFSGYIQILRYAEDPVVTGKYASPGDRTNALQQLLYLNTNRFASLTIADRTGIIFATTDSRISSLKDSSTFAETRANLSPANSDIQLPEAGKHGYVEYTAPLKDVDGSIWGILIGRADPARLWQETLLAAVDGGHNVIINSEGQFAAGVPDELLRLPWHGQPLPNGAVRANIAGVDSICGLAPIGKDTQIDRGLNVASCLPASIIQAEHGAATGKQALLTLAAAILAIVASAALLRTVIRRATSAAPNRAITVVPVIAPEPAPEPAAAAEPIIEAAPVAIVEAIEPEPEPEPSLPPPDIDAVTLIDAYESRNARLAERMRELIQARLLVATTQADEAYKLAGADVELAASLHEKAMADLESLRERDLRAIGQELHPGLVRLGLPGALRAMKKDLADVIEVRLAVDPNADSVSSQHTRGVLLPGMRLVLYRFALESVRAFAFSGAPVCDVTLERGHANLTLRVAGRPADGEVIDPDAMSAAVISVEAYAGTTIIGEDSDGVIMTATVPASPIREAPQIEFEPFVDDDPTEDSATPAEADAPAELEVALTSAPAAGLEVDDQGDDAIDLPASGGDGPVRAFSLDDDPNELLAAFGGPSRGIAGELELIQTELFGSVIVALDIADSVTAADEAGAASAFALAIVRRTVKATILALKAVEAERASVSAILDGTTIVVTVASDGSEAPPMLGEVEAIREEINGAGGVLLMATDGAAVEVTVRIPSQAAGTIEDDQHAA